MERDADAREQLKAEHRPSGSSSRRSNAALRPSSGKALEVLDLRSTGITDRGLPELRLLSDLRWLNLTGCTWLSKVAIEELRRARPKV